MEQPNDLDIDINSVINNLEFNLKYERVDKSLLDTLTNALEDLIDTGLITVSEETLLDKAKLPLHLNISNELKIYPNVEKLLVEYGEQAIVNQINLETEYVEQSVAHYRSIKNQTYQRNMDACTLRPEQIMLQKCIQPFSSAITAYVNKHTTSVHGSFKSIAAILSQLDADYLAIILTKVFLNTVLRKKITVVKLAMQLSYALKNALEYERFKLLKPNLVKRIEYEMRVHGASYKYASLKANVKNYLNPTAWDSVIKTRLGCTLVMMFMQSTGLVKLDRRYIKKFKRYERFVVPNSDVLDTINNSHAKCELFKPVYPPMLVKPLEWSSLELGGYVTNFYTRRQKLVHPMCHSHSDWIEQHMNPELYTCMNHLQNTGYNINKRVLHELNNVIDNGGDCAGIPNLHKEKYLPVKPFQEDQREEFKRDFPEQFEQYKRQMNDALLDWNVSQSKRVMTAYKRMFAQRYEDETIYYPWFFDWRGRLYPCVSYVNPQMDDVGKSLLHFAEAKPIGDEGIHWLEVHGANCYGNDKISFVDRIKFIQDNKKEIFKVAQDPSYSFWHNADSPFKFLAFCFEYYDVHNKYKQPSKQHMTRLPISIDGSCNGLQHYAALLLDSVGGSCVNLVPGDKPSDVYSEVAREVDRLVRIDAQNNVKHASKFVGLVSRKLVKRNVMTLVYGVTRYGMSEQLLEVVKEWKQSGINLNYDEDYIESSFDNDRKACEYLANIVLQAISKINVAASSCMKWLQECASAVKGGMVWFTPMGFPVVQYYMKNQTRIVSTVYGKTKLYTNMLNSHNRPVSVKKQRQSIAPNFIHSLDSAHCQKAILMCKEHSINSLAMIHDSYATHACDTTLLSNLLRKSFVEQYSTCQLTRFRDDLLTCYPNAKLPPMPTKGSLDLQQVLVSPYFFA